MTKKVFLEIGTSNFDTLIPLIENGWQGYCVEPVAEYVQDLLKLNQKVVLSNCAISSYDGMLKMYQCRTDTNEWERGTSHAVKQKGEKILEYKSNSHLIKDTIDVPCYTLQTYLKDNKITSIDMLKIDAEGHEMDIIEAYDWSVLPTYIKMEHYHIDDIKMKSMLEKKGYIVYTESRDLYAIR